MWSFPGVLVLGFKISDGCNKFCGVSRGEDFLTGISRGKVKNLNIPKVVFQKVCAQPIFPCLYVLWNSPIGSRPKFHPFIISWHLNLLPNSKANKIIVPNTSSIL